MTAATRLSGAVVGDVDDIRLLRLDGVDSLETLTTIEGHVWIRCDPAATLEVTLVDPVARTVDLNLGGAGGWLPDDATKGLWNIEIEAAFDDGSILTWPADQPALLPVRDHGA
jgi:hypothetical protein